MKRQNWTRDCASNVRFALLGGIPLIGVLALRAFGDEGSTIDLVLLVMLVSADVMLALKMHAVQRGFAREDARGGYSNG